MNKKGQALVEFVLILPVVIFMLLATIDIAKIFYTSTNLENKLNDIVAMYEEGLEYEKIESNLNKYIKNSSLSIKEDGKYIEFKLAKKVDIITPGLKLIFKDKIEKKRVIYNE